MITGQLPAQSTSQSHKALTRIDSILFCPTNMWVPIYWFLPLLVLSNTHSRPKHDYSDNEEDNESGMSVYTVLVFEKKSYPKKFRSIWPWGKFFRGGSGHGGPCVRHGRWRRPPRLTFKRKSNWGHEWREIHFYPSIFFLFLIFFKSPRALRRRKMNLKQAPLRNQRIDSRPWRRRLNRKRKFIFDFFLLSFHFLIFFLKKDCRIGRWLRRGRLCCCLLCTKRLAALPETGRYRDVQERWWCC